MNLWYTHDAIIPSLFGLRVANKDFPEYLLVSGPRSARHQVVLIATSVKLVLNYVIEDQSCEIKFTPFIDRIRRRGNYGRAACDRGFVTIQEGTFTELNRRLLENFLTIIEAEDDI